MNQDQPVMDLLRQATSKQHDKLEKTPFFEALQEQGLPIEHYVEYLHDLSIVHSVLEHKLSTIDDPVVRLVWHEKLRRFPHLQKDIGHLSSKDNWYVGPSTHESLATVDSILLRFEESPISLLGYLYVLVGSTRGSIQIGQWILEAYNLDASAGMSYFEYDEREVTMNWQDFGQRMNEALQDEIHITQTIDAAIECYNHMEVILRSIYPRGDDSTFIHVTAINPEAGNHPIPDDPRLIQAAICAADRLWKKYPYYEFRYGERGRRFARSDCAWLLTLCNLDELHLKQQADWLAGVLASRGMPTILLQEQFEILHDELASSNVEGNEQYEKLLVAAKFLREKRTAVIDDERRLKLSVEMSLKLKEDDLMTWKNLDTIIFSAVIDEKNGYKNALSSVHDWLNETSKVSEDLLTVVNLFMQKLSNHFEKG